MPDPLPDVAYVESPGGTLYLETPESDRLVTLYERLWAAALGSDESVELISARAEHLQ